MAEIHVYTADGRQSVYAEERVAELLRSGGLPPTALYWRPGMTDWQPLAQLAAASTDGTPPPRRSTGPLPQATSTSGTAQEPRKLRVPNVHFRRYPEPLTTVLQVFLILCLGLTALDLAAAVIHYGTIGSALPDLDAPAGPAPAALSDLAGPTGRMLFIGTCAVALASLIPYFMWVHQAALNSRNFSSIFRFTPRWAVGCSFVPVASFYQPCRLLQEVWKISRNPRTWHNDRASVLVGFWWGLWLLLAVLYGAAIFLGTEAKTHDDIAILLLFGIFLLAVQFAFYAVFFLLITVIVQNQKRIVEAARRKRTATSAPASASASAS